jgi:hypothetical protein
LKKLIKELESPSSALRTTTSQSEISDPGNLTNLYNAIITAEALQIKITIRYHLLGEELENINDKSKKRL